jgi:hypothetical protein
MSALSALRRTAMLVTVALATATLASCVVAQSPAKQPAKSTLSPAQRQALDD